MKRYFLAVLLSLSFLVPLPALAVDQNDLMQKIDQLSKELDNLKQQMLDMQKKETTKDERITNVEKKADEVEKKTDEQVAASSWFKIGGDFQTRLDSISGTTVPIGGVLFGVNSNGNKIGLNNVLTNRMGLNMTALATEDVVFRTRLLMYKIWGEETSAPVAGNSIVGGNAFFADKFFNFDGNIAHIPMDNTLRVDQASATWSNIFNEPFWFSIGRRPSTGGVPTNLRTNNEKNGTAGTPGLLVDYAFDGGTLGWAPDIAALPGAYTKFCFGKGFDNGFQSGSSSNANGVRDVWLIGLQVTPYSTDNLDIEFQWDRALNLMAFPESNSFTVTMPVPAAAFSPFLPPGATFPLTLNIPNTNVGNIDQLGVSIMGKIENLGIGDLNLFLSPGISITSPNGGYVDMTSFGLGHVGLLSDVTTRSKSQTGEAIYLGERYDIKSTGTKIGLEYNHGSKYWITFVPASDDMLTAKLGTRGSVYEAYVIQGLNKKPIAKRGNAFFRLGYQFYDFAYTGSNNWMGAPQKISSLNAGSIQMFSPVKHAEDIYATFNVVF